MEIFVIRHGQTKWNQEARWQGSMDIELDEVGILQAENLANALKDLSFSKIYASPLSRAKVTAETIAGQLNLEVEYLEDLKEICLGPWQGKTSEEAYAHNPELFTLWEKEPEREIGFGIESYGGLQKRAVKVLTDICQGTDENCLIVSHGAWIRALVSHILYIPLNERLCFDIDNTSITVIKYNPKKNRFKIKTLNDINHLKNLSE